MKRNSEITKTNSYSVKIVLIFFIGLSLLFSLAACAKKTDTPVPGENPSSSEVETASDEGETTSGSQSTEAQMLEAMKNIILSGGDSVTVAQYFNENIQQATPDEADQMLDWLIQMQSGLIQTSHEGLLYEPEYLDALNETMNGILDPDKVDLIENQEVKAFYHSLLDSDLTLVRYEETPVAEMDWSHIQSLGGSYTEALQMMVDFSIYRPLLRDEDVETYVDRIYQMEAQLMISPDGFGKEKLLELYDDYVAYALSGPEGSYIYRLQDKSDTYYQKMMAVTSDVKESGFAKVAQTLMSVQSADDFMGLMDIVDGYRGDNPYNPRHWTKVTSMQDGLEMTTFSYEGLDPRISDKVNELINQALDRLVVQSLDGTVDQVSMYRTYGTSKYSTIYIYLNYTDQDGAFQYKDTSVTLDLDHGTLLDLKSLLKINESDFIQTVNALTDQTFTLPPKFEVINTGLLLTAQSEDENQNAFGVITNDILLKIALQ